MSLPFISEATVAELLTVDDAIGVVEQAMRDQAAGRAENLPRQRLKVGGATLHMLAASWEGGGVYGQKIYSVGPAGAQFWVMLYRSDGRPYALVEAQRLGQIRTGAATGVATRALARPAAATVGVLGSGYQMRSQLEAVCKVREIEEVFAWSPTAERLHSFCREMEDRLKLPVRAASSPTQAVTGADVVITLTTAATPILTGSDLRAGMHLNVAGSNQADRREIDASVFARAGTVVIDDLAQARVESGDLILAEEEGALQWDSLLRLADVVADPSAGRRNPQEITLFKSLGIGLWDVSTAAWVAERAIAEGLTTAIDIARGPDALAPDRFKGPA